jgi:hypothetical protein
VQDTFEELPSGKVIFRGFDAAGKLAFETHSYGIVEIGLKRQFADGVLIEETYFSKKRLVSRRSYEKAREAYPDMPLPDSSVEDWGKDILSRIRKQQREEKADAKRRLEASAESRFPRPTGTNWLRVIAGKRGHLVLFASRDWKLLSRERAIPTGREWLHLFGFDGPADVRLKFYPQAGFEVQGDRKAMLRVSRILLRDIIEYTKNPPEVSRWSGSIRPRRGPRKPAPYSWPAVLPPLIQFLESVKGSRVLIFNHHR